MRGVESDYSHMVYQFFSQREKEDAGDGSRALLSNVYRQYSSGIVRRLVLVKISHKLSLISFLYMQIFFLSHVFHPRESNASKIPSDY